MSQLNPSTSDSPLNAQDPGKVLSIISLVLILFFPPAGAVLGFLGRKKSKDAGFSGTLGTVGLIVSLIVTALIVVTVLSS